MPRRPWLIVVVGALSVAACNGDSGAGERAERTTTTTAAVAVTTTTLAPETTTTTEAPLSEEDQIRRETVELFLKGDELYLAPDPSRVAEIYDPDCPCYTGFQADLEDLQNRGLRAKAPFTDVLGVRLDDNSFDGFPSLTLVARSDDLVLVDSDGNEVERRPSTQALAWGISLARTEGRYYIASLELLDQIFPEVLQEVIDLGVP